MITLTTRRLLGLLAILTLFGVRVESQVAPAALEDSARALLAARAVPGGQIVILRDDAVLARVAFGLAHVDSVRHVTHATRFRVGSISKLFTATAAALLWERGALDLDAPVSALVPEFPATHREVTARRLGGHIAGVRHYIPRDFMRPPARFDDVIGPLALFVNDSLVAPPGSSYVYTSFGYNLLGAAVERASGTEFRALLQRSVFEPFGMRATTHERSDSAITDLAHVYNPGGREAARTDLSDRWPSGGFLSTATDLAHFAERSVRGDRLSSRVRALLFTPMTLADGSTTSVGFGWRVGTDPAGRVIYHHGGASIGGRAMLVVWRDLPLAVAITSNMSNARITEADAIALGVLAAPGR